MRPGPFYIPQDSMFPHEGVDLLSPSVLTDPRFSPRAENITFSRGHLSKRFGSLVLGEGLESADTIMALFDYETSGGVRHFLAVTTTSLYRYDFTTEDWVDITPEESSVKQPWTGDEDDVVDWVVGTDETEGRIVILTNGKDTPWWWNGTGNAEEFEPTYTGFVTAKTLTVYRDHLVLGNVETSSREPFLVAWSDTGDFFDFESGNSGANLLADSKGEIEALRTLGDRVMVYSEDSISAMLFLGGTVMFNFEQTVQNTRLLSPRAISAIGPFHVYASQENFYLLDGSRLVRPIGDRVYREYRELVDLSLNRRAFSFHDAVRHLVYFVIPTSTTGGRVYVLEYNVYDPDQHRWMVYDFIERPTAMGEKVREATLLYSSGSLVGLSYLDMTGSYNSAGARAGFPTRMIAIDGEVFRNDDIVSRDGDAVIRGSYETVDFTSPEGFQSQSTRWIELEVDAKGNEVLIEASSDKGQTWKVLKDLSLASQWRTYKIRFDMTSETLRLRFFNDLMSSTFAIRWIRLWGRPGGRSPE
jgi:hypothetical protein